MSGCPECSNDMHDPADCTYDDDPGMTADATHDTPTTKQIALHTWNETDEVYGTVYAWKTDYSDQVVYTIPPHTTANTRSTTTLQMARELAGVRRLERP